VISRSKTGHAEKPELRPRPAGRRRKEQAIARTGSAATIDGDAIGVETELGLVCVRRSD